MLAFWPVRMCTDEDKESVGASRCIGSALEELELGPGASPLGCIAKPTLGKGCWSLDRWCSRSVNNMPSYIALVSAPAPVATGLRCAGGVDIMQSIVATLASV